MAIAPALPTTPWLSTEQQTVWRHYLLGSARLKDRLDADLRQFGLDLAEYEILVTLSEAPDRRVRMSDLAEAVHQSRSRLTHTVTRMEAARLVERVSCPTDRRGVWAQLTEHGFELLAEAAAEHVACVRRHFVEVMSAEDYAAVGRAFAAIARATAD
ncbi:MarR family winged helix-turn-helix transcriptional regulator [uncultured Friedmanniella sp.]|uniref:MarR family winged helix-turn-helix transcriptional regulator n=1 Tax=uncultured Friedmanniella sp. TaxID=335381 RepID=UPI0035CA6567